MTIATSGPHELKQINTSRVLNTLMELGTATRGELARATGLSQPTVNTIIDDLEALEYVRPGAFAAAVSGRRAQTYTFNAGRFCVAAIKVLPGKLDYAALLADGRVDQRGCWQLEEDTPPLNQVCALLDQLFKGRRPICAVSIGVPGVVSAEGEVFAIPQLPRWEGVVLAPELERRYGVPVFVENDMNLMALGYASASRHSPLPNTVVVHLDKGIGAGVIVNGEIVKGFSGFAGEIGYMFSPGGWAGGGEGPVEDSLNRAQNLEERARVAAGLAVNIVCLLNPSVIAFSGCHAGEALAQEVRRLCAERLPLSSLPEFRALAGDQAAYTEGLLAMARAVPGNTLGSGK